jgi:septum formation protein
MKFILGSSSQWRQILFQRHFPEQEAIFLSPEIDERAIRHQDAETLTRLIANAKADALVHRLGEQDEDVLLICMDQVVRCQGSIREKPESAKQAPRSSRATRLAQLQSA